MTVLLLLLVVLAFYVIGELTALQKRVARLEERIAMLRGGTPVPEADASAARAAEETQAPTDAAPRAASPMPLSAETRPAAAPSAISPVVPSPSPITPSPAASSPAASSPVTSSPVTPPPAAPRPAAVPITAPRAPTARSPMPRAAEPALSLEERIGSVWLRNVGLVLLAIGVAYFVNVVHRHLSPAGKIADAYAFALGVFAVGASQRRRLERFARSLMIAGLTLAYFVSFAAYFVAATRCVSLPVALVWMIADLVPVFVLADRWRSQPAAGLALVLGHVSAFVASDRGDAWSLVAITLLALLAVALHLRHAWPPLSLFALGGSYASHLVWFVFGRAGAGTALTIAELRVNIGFLTSYYAIFAAAELAWWQRAAWRAEHRDRDGLVARALGPANVVLYVAVVSLLYTETPSATGIHWFFFALAAVQAILARVHRRLGNPDADFYTALAVVFATIGACGRVDAIALSEVLAVEALILLVAAHRTRLWVFHLLAQAALAANFAHYWLFRPSTASFPTFLGGLLIVAVYLTEAWLEERWYADGAAEWRGGDTPGPLLRPLVRVFETLYAPLAPRLGALHAVAGAVMLVREAAQYLSPGAALRLVTLALLILPLIARVSRSRVLLMAQVVVQAAVALASTSDVWSAWGAAGAGWVAILGLIVTEPRAGCPDVGIVRMLLAVATIALFTLAQSVYSADVALHVAWMTTVGLVCATYDRIAGWRAADDPAVARLRRDARIVTLVAAGPLVWEIVGRATGGMSMPSLYWLRVWGVAFVAAGLVRRDGVLLTAAVAAMAGSLLCVLEPIVGGSPGVGPALRWWLPALDWGIAFAILWMAPRRLATATVTTAGRAAQGIVTIGLVGAAIVALEAPPTTIAGLAPWIVAFAAGFAAEERAGRVRGSAAPDVVALAFSLALVLWADVAAAVAAPMPQGLWLQVAGVVLCAAAALRRHVGLYVAGGTLVLATYAVVLDPLGVRAGGRDPAAFLIVALTLGLALAQDARFARARLPEAARPLAVVGALMPYVLALVLWATEIGRWVDAAWADPARGALALTLVLAATRVRGVVGAGAALGVMLLIEMHAVLTWSRLDSLADARDVLLPALALMLQVIAFERHVRARGRDVGIDAVAERAARAALVALGVAAALVAIDRSRLFGPDQTWVTVGWSLLAGVVMALGFAFRAAEYRRVALAALALCLLRAIVIDTQRLGDLAKPITFVLLAICSLTAAWLYARYAPRIKEWL